VGIAERREREREEVRKKILDAARELFAKEGYEAVTMRRIAEGIEYSPTTIYNHFKDKDDLVRSLCEEDFTRLLSFLEDGPPAPSAVEGLKQLGQAYRRFAETHPNHYRFMFMTPGKFEVRKEGCELPGEQAFLLLRSVAQKAIASGELAAVDPTTLAQILWATLHGAVALRITLPAEHWPVAPPPADFVDQVMENTLRGLRIPKRVH
jgi:AcrR family transcriptional regulator